MSKERKQPKLADILKIMRDEMVSKDLSDDYLKAHGYDVRKDIAGSELSYGITVVPSDWVYPYLAALAEDERMTDIVKDLEESIEAGEVFF